MVTAVILISAFYLIFHRINGDELDSNNPKLTSIIDFINKNGSSIQDDDKIRNQLDTLARSSNIDYYIKDKNNNILYKTRIIEYNSQEKNNFLSSISDIRYNSHGNFKIRIPVTDEKTGQIKYMFFISYYSTISWFILSCVDTGVPFVCFLVYTYIFARKFSKKIRSPLQELMSAVKKIKERDVDFSIKCINQDNEIGDLVQALEEMRSELKDSLLKQWQLEQDRRDMVSSITHDIRTPLAIIQGHVEGLQEGKKYDSEKLNTYLAIIELNIKRTQKLIDDMNALVEIDSEGFSMDSSSVELNDFFKNKIKEMEILANKKEIQMDCNVIDCRQETTPVCLDTNRLSQIIDNLVSNSIRFTPQGGIIRIFAEINQGEATFRISDTGEGFSEKDITNLFKKFYKGDYSRSKEKGHSGLGLYITKSIVEMQGGSIKAFNLAEGGACIEFSIII
jgi:signal transduction histidine kinase